MCDLFRLVPKCLNTASTETLRHRCRTVRTLRHYNLVPKCPGTEVSWCRSVPRAAKKLSKSCWRGTNAAVASFRSCWRFCASSLLLFASLTLRDLVHQTADKKTVAYFHTRTLFRVSHLTHYTTYVLQTIPLSVWVSRLLDTGGTGKRAFFIMFRLSLTCLSRAQRTEKNGRPMWTRYRHRVFSLMYFDLKNSISGISTTLA